WHEHALTTQSDFELDRNYGLGPGGLNIATQIPTNARTSNLNSVASFPEDQNVNSLSRGNDEFGPPRLHAAGGRTALWDGQLAPNAIWRPGYSPVMGNPNQPAVKSNEVDWSFDGKALGNTNFTALTGFAGPLLVGMGQAPLQLPIPNAPPIPVSI